MAFTLRVTGHGSGACVEIPNKNQYTILFCQLGSDVKNPTMYVRFPAGSYRGGRPVRGRTRSKTDRHVVLHNERLFIRANHLASHDETLTINKNKDAISTTPTAYDEYSLHWLPAIDDLAPGHGKLNPAYFDDPLRADPPLVGQLMFTQGRLGTTGVERMQVPFKKEGARQGQLRPMAREILLELDVLDDHFILESHPLDNSPHEPSKNMRFDANGAKTMEIVIGNEPANDIYEPVPPIVPIDVLEQDVAKEYRFYYRLCETPPRDPLFPHVVSRPNGGMFCNKPRFDDVDE